MSNQFYKYLTKKLISFFDTSEEVRAGDRFYIQLDEKSQINEFYQVLKSENIAEKFYYKHEKGNLYESFYLKFKSINLVIVSAANVTDAYLVGIRNASQMQQDVWKNKALLILCDTPVDSITGGCKDLRKDGMPFSVKNISSKLTEEIENSEISKVDREIIKFYINQKLDDSYTTSLWDYEEILAIVNKKKVDENDLIKIGIFRDKALETFTPKSMQKRLRENNNLYTRVEGYQEYADKKEQLEKVFDDKGVRKLDSKDWAQVDFKVVKESMEAYKSEKGLGYEPNKKNIILGTDVIYWEREKADTAAGRRKRYFIVFDNNLQTELELSFSFDEKLDANYLNSKCKEFVEVSGRKLKAKLKSNPNKSTFYKIMYTHKKELKSKYDFNIVVVNIKEEYLQNIKSIYEVDVKKKVIQINSDGSEIKIGAGVNKGTAEIKIENDTIDILDRSCVTIDNLSEAWNEDTLKFNVNFDGNIVPFLIKEQESRIKEITSVNIIKKKLEYKENFQFNKINKITQRTNEFYVKEKLKNKLIYENEIIENKIMFAEEKIGNLEKIDIEVSDNIKKAYYSIIEYYKLNDNIPSLTYINEDLKNLYTNFLNAYNEEIEAVEENINLIRDSKRKNLLKLGTIEVDGVIMFSPFAPLNIAYSLELSKQLSDQAIDTHILERFTGDNLLPYIYNHNDEIYRPLYQKDNLQWIIFENREKVAIGQTNVFVAKVVREKIEQFKNNFNYIFISNSSAPIKINIININNDKEVVKGVFEYIKNQIRLNASKIVPIQVNVYNDGEYSAFDTFFEMTSIEKLEEEFNISFKINNNQIDKIDVLRMILTNIKYFKKSDTNYEYAHISFYKSLDNKRAAHDNMSSIETGLSLNGIMSGITSNNDGDDYRIGFGTKNLLNESGTLVRTAINTNELAANLYNDGANPYRKRISIVTRPTVIEDIIKEKLFATSHWITFIEPGFGLEYFKESCNDNLIVIHYSDQYSTTDQYDTITVTSKSNQYKFIIKEFLEQKNINNIDDKKIDKVISNFNTINGEWLLNLIANKGEYDREKISIISAVKYALAMFNNEDIIWIPVSLEEILRVSGAVKLNKSEGLFTLKNLKQKGIHSDDLMFIGINSTDKNNIKVFYYPIEVKIGYNFESVIDKGEKQVEKTYSLLKKQLSKFDDEGKELFKNKVFRNFFAKILITNAQKFDINGFWNEKNVSNLNSIKKYLLNDEYKVSFELEKYIGKGALISFKKDNHWRSANIENDIMFIELTEDDAYRGIEKSVEEIYSNLKAGKNDIILEDLLYNIDLNSILGSKDKKNINNSLGEKFENSEVYQLNTSNQRIIESTNINKESKTLISDSRVLLGKVEGSTKNIYWEFGNKNLANRHMLITGKSGNGKTYFIQCALKELISLGIPAIIIDYTDGFKSSQLEPEFKVAIGDDLKQFIVAANKFPLNIFKKGIKELDEDLVIEEDNVDVAERFKSVIGAVYKDLGIQQLNSIYQNVLRGLEKHNGSLNLRSFKNELEEDKSSYAQTALSQLNVLIDKNPFDESAEFDWEELHKGNGKLFIIQLTGYTKEVQKIITEMILWNLYIYKSQHGSKDKPFAIVLDEAQNLNFGENSPSTKILTEGRKFGWSAWFSTQFLKGQMDKATISRLQNSAQKIYFAQTEEEANAVANIFGETLEDKKIWMKKLINLEKGTCISYGPILNEDGNLIQAKPVKIRITQLNNR